MVGHNGQTDHQWGSENKFYYNFSFLHFPVHHYFKIIPSNDFIQDFVVRERGLARGQQDGDGCLEGKWIVGPVGFSMAYA